MNHKSLFTSFCLSLAALSPNLYATNLLEVYQDAVNSDPTFKEAQANWMANKMNLPIARTAFMPSINLSASRSRLYHKTRYDPQHNLPDLYGSYTNAAYSLSLQQPIFNFQSWHALSQASNTVKAAGATFNNTIQDLIIRTTQAYCNILIAQANLRFTIAEKRAYLTQLNTAKEKYHVGLIAITPLYDARASYDNAVEQEIIDRNQLSNQREALRAITGKLYPSLKALGSQVPLVTPSPNNIQAWINRAEKQNFGLQAQHYRTLAARDNIKIQSSARLPSLSATASYSYNEATHDPNSIAGYAHTNNAEAGLSINFPIFQGGFVFTNTRQARYLYSAESAHQEWARRRALNNTRTSFLGVISGISQIKADAQAIRSQKKALETTIASYNAGTRTMVDVLAAYSTLYNNQAKYTQAQYNYIMQSLELKKQAGTLSLNDLRTINQWLTQRIRFKRSRNDDMASTSIIKKINKKTDNNTKKVDSPTQKQAMKNTYYTIQVFAAKSAKMAKHFLDQKKHESLSLQIIQGKRHHINYYKVVHGQYTSSKMAQKDLKQLKQKFSQAWITQVSTNPNQSA